MTKELGQDELKAALAAADRGMRLPYATLFVSGMVNAGAIAVAMRRVDWGNATHVLIVCAVVVLFTAMNLLAGILQARQNAANARMIRALELMDERLGR